MNITNLRMTLPNTWEWLNSLETAIVGRYVRIFKTVSPVINNKFFKWIIIAMYPPQNWKVKLRL